MSRPLEVLLMSADQKDPECEENEPVFRHLFYPDFRKYFVNYWISIFYLFKRNGRFFIFILDDVITWSMKIRRLKHMITLNSLFKIYELTYQLKSP